MFRADEEYVVMTDCDSILRINYNDIIEQHIKTHADITMVYKKRKLNEKELGTLLAIDNDKRINNITYDYSKAEEEQNIFTNIYVMKKSLLQNIVTRSISHNYHHFMADVIASNLSSLRIMGFEHKGFFAGINSLQSYYKANMLLLDENIRREIFGDRSVFTKIRDSAPTKYGNSAIVKNSLIADGCEIYGEVENSIIFRNVKVARGAVVKNSIVMQNTVLGENSSINCIIVDKNVVIRDRKNLSGDENHTFYISKGMMI